MRKNGLCLNCLNENIERGKIKYEWKGGCPECKVAKLVIDGNTEVCDACGYSKELKGVWVVNDGKGHFIPE